MKKLALSLFVTSNNSFYWLMDVCLMGCNWMLKVYYNKQALALNLSIVYPNNGIIVYLSIKNI